MYGRGFSISKTATAGPFVSSLGGLNVGSFETNVFDYRDLKANYMKAGTVYYDSVS